MVRYEVTLTAEERKQLQSIMRNGKHSSLQFRKACILLNCDEGEHGQRIANEQIAQILQVNIKTIERLKQRLVEEGFEACTDRKPYPEVKNVKTDGDFEADLLAISCSKARTGIPIGLCEC